jgi:hypothetical protein
MKKVRISYTLNTKPEAPDDQPLSGFREFIFGLGKEGLTPFESALSGKKAGESVSISGKKKDLHAMFEHLTAIMDIFPSRLSDEFMLTVNIDDVANAPPREIVKELARSSACDHHHDGEGCCNIL